MRPFTPDVPTPCKGDDWRLWISEDAAERDEAARRCTGCPVIVACYTHGDREGEVGVWGGVDLGMTKRPAKPQP